MTGYSLEVVRRIYDDSEGVYLEVGPDADSLGLVTLSTRGEENGKHYGDIMLCMTSAQARLVAEALIACAAEMSKPTPAQGEGE